MIEGLCDGTIDAIATDHAPHAPEAKDVPFDQAPPGMLGLETALADRLGRAVAAARTRAGLRPDELAARRHRRPDRDRRPRGGHSAHGGPVEAGRRPTCACSTPRPPTVVDPRRLASRSRNTPYAGRDFTGAGAPHRAAGRAGRDRRGGPAMTDTPRAATARRCLVLADGDGLRGRGRRRRRSRSATGELVFNTAMSGYQEVITDPSYAGQVIAFTYHPHRQLRHQRRRRRGRRAALPRRGRPRPRRRALNWRADRGPRAVPGPPRRARPDRRRHPAPDPAPARRRAPCRAPSGPPARPSCGRGGAAAEPAPTAWTWSRGSPPPEPVPPAATGRCRDRRLRLRRQGHHAPPPGGAGDGDRRAGRRRPADEVLALEPDGVFLSNGPG